jgi:mono/diheme cytochrome c family protein
VINMKTTLKVATAVAATLLMVMAGGVWYVVATGLSARPAPGSIETRLARAVRQWAVPRDVHDRTPPLPSSADAVDEALNHFARYCATCHANDGSGEAPIGKALFPRAPDMRQAPTQELTDGDLFYIIEYGVRFTGMPAWGDGSPKGEELGWKLVHFIRHLPKLTPEELKRMERQNPKLPQ